MNHAILSNKGKYTSFQYKDKVIRFRSPYSLEYYSEIKEWDNGYLVVMTKYTHSDQLIEEYIDLDPILNNLYINKEVFLQSIQGVIIQND